MTREITIGQLASAMRANGYEQGFGSLVNTNEAGEVVQACAMGQAMLNLDEDFLAKRLHLNFDAHYEIVDTPIAFMITYLNDEKRWPLKDIADLLDHMFITDWHRVVIREREPKNG